MDKIYVTELDKPPLDEDTLAHYGVLGMKWGVRKNPEKAFAKAAKKSDKYAKKIYKTNKKYIKEAKKVSRFFGRKRAQQKVVRLNAKKDYLTAKKDKWEKKTKEIFDKEYKRTLDSDKLTTNQKSVKISNLRNAYENSRKPRATKAEIREKLPEVRKQLNEVAPKMNEYFYNSAQGKASSKRDNSVGGWDKDYMRVQMKDLSEKDKKFKKLYDDYNRLNDERFNLEMQAAKKKKYGTNPSK